MLLVSREGVEDVELVRGPRETPLLELSRHRDQPLGRRGKVFACDRASPCVCTGAAVGEDPPRERQARLVLRLQVGERRDLAVVEEAFGYLQLGLDVRLASCGPDRGRVALDAEQQPDRLREDRLARPGLAAEDVQTGNELELGLANEDEVLDPEAAQHRS